MVVSACLKEHFFQEPCYRPHRPFLGPMAEVRVRDHPTVTSALISSFRPLTKQLTSWLGNPLYFLLTAQPGKPNWSGLLTH
jgi:hypothetical protein